MISPRAPLGTSCARLALESDSKFHAVITFLERLQVEACGEIDRANPLETPEIVVARVYATSVNLQVWNLFLFIVISKIFVKNKQILAEKSIQ